MHPLIGLFASHHGLNQEETELLGAALLRSHVLDRGDDVAHDRSNLLHLVSAGWVYEYVTLKDGRWIIVRFATRGEIVSPTSLWDQDRLFSIGSLGARVATLDAGRLGQNLPTQRLRELFAERHQAQDNDLARAMVSTIAGRAHERIAALFFGLMLKAQQAGTANGSEFHFPATQAQIAAATGLSQVHVNRCLQQLRKDGLMDWRNGTVQILRPEALRSIGLMDYAPVRNPHPPGGDSTP